MLSRVGRRGRRAVPVFGDWSVLVPVCPSPTVGSSVRSLAAAAALLATGLALTACGGDAEGSGPASGQPPDRARGGLAADPQVRACLSKQGVTLPARGGRGGRPPGGRPPAGTNARPPTGTTTQPRRGGPGRDPAQRAKLQAALKACGVAPTDRRGPPTAGATPTQTVPSAAAN